MCYACNFYGPHWVFLRDLTIAYLFLLLKLIQLILFIFNFTHIFIIYFFIQPIIFPDGIVFIFLSNKSKFYLKTIKSNCVFTVTVSHYCKWPYNICVNSQFVIFSSDSVSQRRSSNLAISVTDLLTDWLRNLLWLSESTTKWHLVS